MVQMEVILNEILGSKFTRLIFSMGSALTDPSAMANNTV